jgi:Putative transposase
VQVTRAQREVIQGRRLRVDTTVVETNVHYTTDSALLADGVRLLPRTLKRLGPRLQGAAVHVRDRGRSVARRVFAIGQRTRTATARNERPVRERNKAKLKQLDQELMGITRAVVRDAERVTTRMPCHPAPALTRLAERLRTTVGLVHRVLPGEESSPTDPVAEQMPLLAEYAAASIQGLVASGPRAGHPVRRLRSAAAVGDGAKPRCARREGFSLHANGDVPAHARARLEHLCRYLLRPPLARERLTASAHGQLLFELAPPRADGTTHLLLEPLELIEKIALLIPTIPSNCAT